jgi:hypothetical protein
VLSLLRLLFRLLVVRRRSLAAWAVYLSVLAVLNSGPTGPAPEAFALTSAVLLAITTWLVMSGMVSDQATTSMLAAAAGGPRRLHLLATAAGVLAALPLAVLATLWDTAAAGTSPSRLPAALSLGLLAHLAAVLVGAGIGTLAARPVTRDDAVALLVGAGGCLAAVGVRGSTPFWPLLAGLSDRPETNASGAEWWSAVASAAGWCAASGLWLVALAVLAGTLAGRRRAYGAAAEG